MLEIEIKAYCPYPGKVIKMVGELGAKHVKSIDEYDVYYNHPSRDFAVTDEAVRLRSDNEKSIFTYKGPKLSSRSKSRVEREVAIDDYDTMDKILKDLGFVRVDAIKKYRQIYRYQDIDVCIDTVEGLGTFVELEKQGTEQEIIEDELFHLASLLGLVKFERTSYLEMKLGKKTK